MPTWILRLCLGLFLFALVACDNKKEAKPGTPPKNDPNFKPGQPPKPPPPQPPPGK